jgi:L-seryl-tRNA(Ser) seleniumtransferase
LEILNIETELSKKECCFSWAMILLKDFGIITIPAVGMPGASASIRFDLSAQDVIGMDINQLYEMVDSSIEELLNICQDVEKSKELIFY